MSIRKHRKGQKYMYSTQLFVAIVTASIVILTVGLVTLYGVSGRTVMEINNEMKKSTAETCAETVDREFSHINDVIHAVFLQDETLAQLTQDASKIPSSFTVIRHAMLSAISYSDRISCMGIYDNLKGAVNTKSGLDLPYSDYESCRDYFGSLPEAAQWQNSTWYFCEKEPVQLSMASSNQGRAIVNYRELTPMTESTPKKLCMVLYLSESKLCDLYSYMGQGSCILSAKGTVISAVDKSLIGQPADEQTLEQLEKNERKSFVVRSGNAQYRFFNYLPTISAWLVTSAGSESLRASQRLLTLAAAATALVGLFISVATARFLSSRLAQPLVQLKQTMLRVERGDLTARSNLNRSDEIGYLGDSFNLLMESLLAQFSELSREQDLRKESEMRLLQAQINPHLLYNTLDSALYLIEDGDGRHAAQILEELSRFFKLSLQSGNRIVTLDTELQHVDAYLNLQNLCRMKNFTLQTDVPPELREQPMLHMLLQPIVENSVLHGFEGNFSDGTISIRACRAGRFLVVTVRDDGVGMDEAELQALRKRIASPEPGDGSFALWNIARRIGMFYGPEGEVTVSSEFGEYTAVTIRIPLNKDGGAEHV